MRVASAPRFVVSLVIVGLVSASWAISQAETPPKPADEQSAPATEASPGEGTPAEADGVAPRRVKPKPIVEQTEKGLAYLVSQQNPNGGWGQGGGWRQATGRQGGRVEGENVADPTDLGNTCIATLALIRAGNTPEQGPYAKNVARAVEFICQQIEGADADSLYVTAIRDTQLQSKIGRYADTFLAGLVLSELKGKMPDEKSDARLIAALDKTVSKIEKNQKEDGTFAGNEGWASVLSIGLCSKFINRAAQNNVAVDRRLLERDFDGSVNALAQAAKPGATEITREEPASASGPVPARERAASGRFGGAAAARGDAGIDLYFFASNFSRVADQANTWFAKEGEVREVLANPRATKDEKEEAQQQFKQIDKVRAEQTSAVNGIVAQLDDERFLAGFGNNGGEEFLSYMNISEMLLVKGGPEWDRWDKSITNNLHKAQNGDGSWSGQHCITGRTFCTSAALLTLLADRAPLPLAAAPAADADGNQPADLDTPVSSDDAPADRGE